MAASTPSASKWPPNHTWLHARTSASYAGPSGATPCRRMSSSTPCALEKSSPQPERSSTFQETGPGSSPVLRNAAHQLELSGEALASATTGDRLSKHVVLWPDPLLLHALQPLVGFLLGATCREARKHLRVGVRIWRQAIRRYALKPCLHLRNVTFERPRLHHLV
eukprot:CAMPEP_0183479814 /NCGR_PEP_ID=MMETSP0370-20130417/172284_1 /TAXON_ID=268820 /ORGANISM="Peridinium aciculiferum, Strain PAER-2" /LENGTH=164 /DNA_ID=CAMNT_0025672859 /DNA_START=44 /DNA_END=533 /DNA_ORIENTATION=-